MDHLINVYVAWVTGFYEGMKDWHCDLYQFTSKEDATLREHLVFNLIYRYLAIHLFIVHKILKRDLY